MNIFEMMRNGELHVMAVVWPIQALVISILCFLIAKSKLRNEKRALILGLIPIINYVALIYYVGVAKLEKN